LVLTLTRAERDALLEQVYGFEARLYPAQGAQRPDRRTARWLREGSYQVLGEYADRLPRILMGACPFTGSPFLRSFDPFGLDGPWWHQDREVALDEPAPPPTFKVLLGALSLHGRTPSEVRDPVLPGPEVPFVVPRLLGLPGMVAVLSRLELETGDVAFPVSYYSPEDIPPQKLHQFWLEQDYWFELDGKSGWLIANDPWDFDLEPWIAAGKLRWIGPDDDQGQVLGVESGVVCPYLGLAGDRLPQHLAGGERELGELPDGTPINPYEE
jgi:hypothetical protein